ncbi:TPA: hypothetical protein DCZ46_01500 [Candidatus Campbellbacteria bacterium]|nr:hypothetical protein [Candidatus Campbellbacteria bacterium]HAQ02054.1 hypothetical protein [Candidatus Campbellbacteria bacterium]HBC70622.1 hypothetical protein [Candidatus Campbellbacteria bacterium]
MQRRKWADFAKQNPSLFVFLASLFFWIPACRVVAFLSEKRQGFVTLAKTDETTWIASLRSQRRVL